MKFHINIAYLGLFAFIFSSCDPDGFPNKEDMVGTWVEQAPFSDTLTFRSNGSLVRHSSGVVDTLIFETDGEKGTLSIRNPRSTSQGETTYDVLFANDNHMFLVNYRGDQNPPADGNFIRQ